MNACTRIGILVGGGPAPGTNAVIAAATIEALNCGVVPIGLHDGFEWLGQRYTDEQHELTVEEVSRIHLHGGVTLGSSRYDLVQDPDRLDNAVAALKKLKIDALLAIGGDDLVRSALAIAEKSNGAIQVALVPKSIDNDIWMPSLDPTLGYETARHVGVQIVSHLMEDARTAGRWYLGVTMGRPTGHLTLGIGKAASATCTIIPEEFGPGPVSLASIADIVEGCIIKRRAHGRPFGVVLLSEALVERFDPAEVKELQDVDRDAQGNVRVTEIDLGRKVKNEVQVRLERRGIKVTMVDKTIGYELRCAPPIPYDAEYARDLGYAAVQCLIRGHGTQASLVAMQDADIVDVPLASLIDPETRRGRRRPVDVTSASYQVARDYMVRIGPRDFEDPAWTRTLAEAGQLSEQELRERFARA